ncbi:MAG: twin-arginine translocase TatA/TatE family subunit [Erythrobacter sp.]|nr:twin-arginine translocase TatA/TatE family subunit [Erythrobacter sp.]
MGGIGIWQILIVALVILVLFGRGKISEMMGDFGKGISSFKKGMSEEEDDSSASKAQIEAPAKDVTPAESTTSERSDSAS